MAQRGTDLLSRLADAGEEAIARLGDAPGAERLLGVATSMRDRVDELQKRMRGLEGLENRIAALERRVDELGGGKATPAKRPTAKTAETKKTPTAKTRTTRAKTTASEKPPSPAAGRAVGGGTARGGAAGGGTAAG